MTIRMFEVADNDQLAELVVLADDWPYPVDLPSVGAEIDLALGQRTCARSGWTRRRRAGRPPTVFPSP